MQPLKVSAGRRPRYPRQVRRTGMHHGRTGPRQTDSYDADLRHLPRRETVLGRRLPYLELAVTIGAFLFVLFVVFGGTQPPQPDVASTSMARTR